MKQGVVLTVTSLLAILLLSVHVSHDLARGIGDGGFGNLVAMGVLAVFLYGTLMLRDRRSGLVIIILVSLSALAMPVLHLRHKGLVINYSGVFFFIWTLYALGTLGVFGLILSLRELLGLRSAQQR